MMLGTKMQFAHLQVYHEAVSMSKQIAFNFLLFNSFQLLLIGPHRLP